ncbi:TetR/AcrR family transcriptional regulator [Clostridium septicum]|uniref:TetR family transcriptional regulator n=1 Tax=Clostridium septicum TaxID=1504 RepID=A0A9N7JLF1_CLOSE|nr:TetR family transcriptional regulator [Clostridium septicum]AYE34673.1 TetR/AcrR family transcriptional regulator [Clostridium septicum]MDU1314344.1 TetR family transcriptional regulator [Clostridium septicum]QAS60073.1 TetR/AcrR family transcriptional regulator [Clostridium septicum]UEC20683.1 TetR family transcriptional regulator [Clostridium septicum]USS01266.1 TetR family transcriptional regulator [Clostridium septicum]
MNETKELILKNTIELISKKGDATIREIAEKAKVNVASINYHFGNKNNLLKEVESYFSETLYRVQNNVLENPNLDAEEKIIQWALELMEFMFKYPSIVSLISKLVNEENAYSPAILDKVYMNSEIIEKLSMLIAIVTNISDEKIIQFKYLQIFSGILGPVLNELLFTIYRKENSLSMRNENIREEYIRYLVRTNLK